MLSPSLQDDSSQLVAKLQRFKQNKYPIMYFNNTVLPYYKAFLTGCPTKLAEV